MPRARKSNPKPEPQTIASYDYAQAGRVNLPTADNAAVLIPPHRETPQTLSEQTVLPPP